MRTLIRKLRAMTEAGKSDYTLAEVTYWQDDQLQDLLDEHRQELVQVALSPRWENVDGSAEYHNYFIPRQYRHFEEAGADSAWSIEDGNGSAIGTAAYTVNYEAGRVRFTNDTEGAGRYLSALVFDLNRAAAEVWERKAAHYAPAYDFAADGASYKRSQMHAHCLEMAARYRGKGGLVVGRLVRDDAY
jgi:hypothetical protein